MEGCAMREPLVPGGVAAVVESVHAGGAACGALAICSGDAACGAPVGGGAICGPRAACDPVAGDAATCDTATCETVACGAAATRSAEAARGADAQADPASPPRRRIDPRVSLAVLLLLNATGVRSQAGGGAGADGGASGGRLRVVRARGGGRAVVRGLRGHHGRGGAVDADAPRRCPPRSPRWRCSCAASSASACSRRTWWPPRAWARWRARCSGLHVPETRVIAICVALRFFPTLSQEFASGEGRPARAGHAPDGGVGRPASVRTLERVLVPVMSRLAIVADELSNAAMARGMDSACRARRTTVCAWARWTGSCWRPFRLGRVPAGHEDGSCLMDAVIQLKGAGFRYASAEAGAVGGIDLVVHAGEVVVVTGPSGLREDDACAHGERPRSGDVRGCCRGVGSRGGAFSWRRWELDGLARVVGSVFQNPRTQFFNLDTTSEIAFGCENAGFPATRSARAWTAPPACFPSRGCWTATSGRFREGRSSWWPRPRHARCARWPTCSTSRRPPLTWTPCCACAMRSRA